MFFLYLSLNCSYKNTAELSFPIFTFYYVSFLIISFFLNIKNDYTALFFQESMNLKVLLSLCSCQHSSGKIKLTEILLTQNYSIDPSKFKSTLGIHKIYQLIVFIFKLRESLAPEELIKKS